MIQLCTRRFSSLLPDSFSSELRENFKDQVVPSEKRIVEVKITIMTPNTSIVIRKANFFFPPLRLSTSSVDSDWLLERPRRLQLP